MKIMLPNGRLKAILILVAGMSFVALGIYQVIVPDAFAETETFEYETTPYGIYKLHFHYEGVGMFEILLGDKKLGDGLSDDRIDSSTIQFTTDQESIEINIISENVDVTITELEYTGQLTSEQIESNFPEPVANPKDQRIEELEQRINELEDLVTGLQNINDGLDSANKKLENINKELHVQIRNLQTQLENANLIVREQLRVIIDTLANFKLG